MPQTFTIKELTAQGATFEDKGYRAWHHFYDPLHDKGLYGGLRSPDWALEDRGEYGSQYYSYKDARRYLLGAYTAPTKKERDKFWGLTFETLGHVMHHLQDMAQPEHVRNDAHLDVGGALPFFEDHSAYEAYAAGPIYAGDYPAVRFNRLRDYWHTDDNKGIADYTQRGFVSKDSNFRGSIDNIQPHPSYPLPNGSGATVERYDLSLLFGADSELAGFMHLIGTPVHDAYQQVTESDFATSTYSIFDFDLQRLGKAPVFGLNQFNFLSMSSFLTPRAVAYSAGLVDYFFRGRLQAANVRLVGNVLEFRVKNVIADPVWSAEALYSGGRLLLSYRFQRLGETDVGNSASVTLTETIAPGQISTNSYQVTLAQALADPDAVDIEYFMVYSGRIGEETDSVAIGNLTPKRSGFVFKPSATPTDGITGTRSIYYGSHGWKLSTKPGEQAGNIDWKGFYVNGKATRVLTWNGPSSRYFPERLNAQGNTIDPFGHSIYQGGELYAHAPHPVLGAALNKDAQGQEWLVVICRGNVSGNASRDVVYRRPNVKHLPSAVYDAVKEPLGWQQTGSFTLSEYRQGEVPWFFNGPGTEAQTMRPVLVYTGGQAYYENHRLKISVVESAATLTELGNFPEGKRTVTDYSKYDGAPNEEYTSA